VKIELMRIVVVLAGLCAALMATQGWGAVIDVDTSLDLQAADGVCSLREAMLNAEGADQSGSVDCTAGSAGDNQIVMAASLSGSVIDLTGGVLPTITRKVEIRGPVEGDPEGLAINAGSASRIFEIDQASAVMLADLKLVKGQTSNPGQPGGAIWINAGADVVLEHIWIENGVALEADGGAIAVFDSLLTLDNSFLQSNSAGGGGGAILASNSTVQIDDSTFDGNTASGPGGAIQLTGGQLTINNSDFTQHSTIDDGAQGGALFVDGADLILNDSLVSDNATQGQGAQGGGIYLTNGDLHMSGGSIQNNVGQGEFASGGGVRLLNGSAFFSGGCQIRDNLTNQHSGYGGGVRINGGDLTMNNCVVEGNRTLGDNSHGGGLYVINGNAVIEFGQIRDNSTAGASAQGGGLRVLNGSLDMVNSQVENNATEGDSSDGGGLFHRSGDVTIVSTVIRGNETAGDQAHGGGLYLNESVLSISDSVVEGNILLGSARGAGMALFFGDYAVERVAIIGNQSNGLASGGVYANESDLVVINSTLSGNVADSEAGSALRAFGGNTDLIHVTVAENVNVSSTLGHVHVGGAPSDPGNLSLVNSLVVNNRCSSSSNGTLYVANSVSSDESCTGQAMPESAIQLGTLADNGGPSSTYALGYGSIAINAGGNCLAGLGISVDQRGQARPGGTILACDAGAYEFQGAAPEPDLAVSIVANPDPVEVDQELVLTIRIDNQGSDPASNIEVLIDWPADLTFASADPDFGEFDHTTGLWQINALLASASPELTLDLYPTAQGDREVNASVSALQVDPDPGNNSATATIEVIAPDSIFDDRFRYKIPRSP